MPYAGAVGVVALILAHSWYDAECCGLNDCRPAKCEEFSSYNEFGILYHSRVFHRGLVRPSKDGNCHICMSQSGSVRCAYFPGVT